MNLDKQIEQARSLPLGRKEEWIMERKAVDLPTDESGVEVSSDILVCVSPDVGIIGATIISSDAADSEALSWALDCMISPMEGKPRRPGSILLSGGDLEALRPALVQIGAQVRVQSESHPFVDGAVSLIEEGMSEEGLPPYLIEPDMDKETVADFFDAAAEFYKTKPWKYFEFEIPMKVVLALKSPKTYWAVVMGTGGEHFGLSLFWEAEDLEAFFGESSLEEDELAEGARLFGFSYENVDDIGQIPQLEYQANGWALAGKSAYPSVMLLDPSDNEGPRMPNKKQFEDLIAVTRAVTRFCTAYRKQIKKSGKELEIIEDTFTVSVSGRPIEVSVEFPAPESLTYEDIE